MLETLVDLAARKLGIDPAELRRRNMIPAERDAVSRPRWSTPTTAATSARTSKTASSIADYAGFEARRRESLDRRQAARHRNFQHRRGVQCRPDRTRRVALRSHPARSPSRWARTTTARATPPRSARSSPTSSAFRPDRVRYQYGDTDQVAIGTGTFGSRSMACGGTALLMAADKVIAKGKKLAAHAAGSRRARHRVRERQVHRHRHRQDHRAQPRSPSTRSTCARCRRAWKPACSRAAPSTAASAPIRTAAMSSRSRSTKPPAWSSSCATMRSTTSAT